LVVYIKESVWLSRCVESALISLSN